MAFVPDSTEVKATPVVARQSRFAPDAPVAAEPVAPPARPVQPKPVTSMQHVKRAGRLLVNHPLTTGIGMAENALSGVTGGVGAVVEAVTGKDPGSVDIAYRPRTAAGKEIAELTGEEGTKVGEVFDKVAGTGPLAQTLKERLPQAAAAAGTVAGAGALAKPVLTPKPKPTITALTDDPIANARAVGYETRPSDVRVTDPSKKTPGVRREGLQDPAELKQDIGLKNQAKTTQLAAEDIGASTKNKLMPEEFERLREPHMKVYEGVEKAVAGAEQLPEFTKAQAAARARTDFRPTDKPTTTQIISALRRQERKKARANDVATNKDGIADRNAADALEGALEAQLKGVGNEKLFKSYQESRTALAKLHDVQSVTRGGQVDAIALRALARRGVPLSGRLKLIADTAEHLENVMKPARRLTGVKGGTTVDSKAGAIKASAKAVLRNLPGMDVRSTRFQNKFGREGLVTKEAFEAYGKRSRPKKPTEPRQGELPVEQGPPAFNGLQPPPGAPLGRARPESVDFEPTGGLPPGRTQTLAGDLGLAPEPVPGAVEFPPAPSRLTAETPPTTPQGGLAFTTDSRLANDLAGDLSVAPSPTSMADMIDYIPPSLAEALAGELFLEGQVGPLSRPAPLVPTVEPPPGNFRKVKPKKAKDKK